MTLPPLRLALLLMSIAASMPGPMVPRINGLRDLGVARCTDIARPVACGALWKCGGRQFAGVHHEFYQFERLGRISAAAGGVRTRAGAGIRPRFGGQFQSRTA